MIGVNQWLTAAALAGAMTLAGCTGSAPVVHTEQYTLGPVPAARDTGAEHAAANGPVLRVAEISAPLWLDSTRIYYRLDYRADAEIAAYSQSEWVAPPPILLAGILESALAGMTRWKAVIGPGVTADADMTLRVTLNDFQQVFASRTRSAAVVDATATLIGDTLIAQRRFRVVAPAPEPDAPGGVEALSRASRELGRRLRDWLEVTLGPRRDGS